jgi:cellobiose phosphorylase
VEEVDRYTKLREQLRDGLLKFAVISQDGARRILHGWGDRRRYFVGSFHDCDGLARDGLTSNAFWVLSDMLGADGTLKPHILAALHRLDSPFGFKTFSPGFAADASGVGRINRLPMGAAENGAAYLHATTFAIAALFRMGQAKHAWQQIAKIMPFAPHHEDASHSPFVMPNSYVFNQQLNLTGQSMNDWQTGCSNVLLKLLVRYVFGFRPGLDGLRVAPANWLPFDGFVFHGTAHGKQIRITLHHADVLSRRFTVNGFELRNTTYDESAQTITAQLDYAALESDLINDIVVIDPRPLL